MDEMITFEKDYQTRLEEYMLVFGDNILPAKRIKKQWSIYLEFMLDTYGWKALWKIPKCLCDKLVIPYPTVVIVKVNSISFEDFTAQVQVIAVQGDVDIEEEQVASLNKLWPTKEQDASLDITTIANILDMYRFFYYQLWMPWDLQESDNTDWIKTHLSDRLHLFYNIKNGFIPNNKARKFRLLLAEIRSTLEFLGDDGTSNFDYYNDHSDTFIDLRIKIADLKHDIEILRTYFLHIKSHLNDDCSWLVFNSNCTLEKYSEYLESVRKFAQNGTKYKTAVTLQDALDSANNNDTIVIDSGIHVISSAGVLDEGAILKSHFTDPNKAVIESRQENCFSDFSGKYLILENIFLNIPTAQCGIIAQTGSVVMKNCIMKGQGSASTQHGIIIGPGGSGIKLENCHISGFEIGIFLSDSASLVMINCTISDVKIPIKVNCNAIMELVNCKFKYNEEHCFCIQSESDIKEETTGGVSLLQSKMNAKIIDCTFKNNTPVKIKKSCTNIHEK